MSDLLAIVLILLGGLLLVNGLSGNVTFLPQILGFVLPGYEPSSGGTLKKGQT